MTPRRKPHDSPVCDCAACEEWERNSCTVAWEVVRSGPATFAKVSDYMTGGATPGGPYLGPCDGDEPPTLRSFGWTLDDWGWVDE